MALLASLGALACGAVASAQTIVDDAETAKTLTIVRLAGAPRVDGVLDEPTWANATLVVDLHQLDPVEFAPPSQRSEIRLYYDDDALYVAARLWDTEADRITAQVLRQGEGLGSEDRFSVILDPYLDRRNGYRFQVNPNGVRWEALYQDTSNLESNWDGIWLGAATRDAEGWTAEMAIPFKTLSFNPNNSDWGINFERTIQRNGETLGWVSRNRQMNPGVAGTATGFEGLKQGAGLDVVPSMSVRREQGLRDRRDDDRHRALARRVLQGDAVAECRADDQHGLLRNRDRRSPGQSHALQLVLSREARLLPAGRRHLRVRPHRQRRLSGRRPRRWRRRRGWRRRSRRGGGNPAIPGAAVQNARPFFSRKLGLSSTGEIVDIEHGAKLSGRVGRWSLGALAIRQDDFGLVEGDDTFVARVCRERARRIGARRHHDRRRPAVEQRQQPRRRGLSLPQLALPGGRLLEGQAWYQETDNDGLNARTERRVHRRRQSRVRRRR